MHIKIDPIEKWTADPARSHDDGAGVRTGKPCPIAGIHICSHHQMSETLRVEIRNWACGYSIAAAQNGHTISDLKHLVKAMRHVKNARPAVSKLSDDPQQRARVLRRQHSRRLIEHQEPSSPFPSSQGSGNGDNCSMD